MSILSVFKKCPVCKKKYSWNPDAGQMWCPNCGPTSVPGMGDVPWGKNKEKDKENFQI